MRPEKQLLVEEINDGVNHHGSFLVMKYKGLSANLANKLRRGVQDTGGSVSVMKKRILNLAMKKRGIEFDPNQFEGHLGVVFTGEDPIASTKTVFEFSKENGDVIDIIAGHVEGKVLNADQVTMLSTLPGKDGMRAQLLGTLEAPLSQTLTVLDALLLSVVYCLDNKSKL